MAAKKTGISRDLLIHPGETISDILEERDITQAALAARTGVSTAFISNVISGKKDISANFAMALEYALGVPRSFWLNLQANYDAELVEIEAEESITKEEYDALKNLSEITRYFQQTGIIDPELTNSSTVLALRRALNVSNLTNLNKIIPQGAFRISEKQKMNPLVLGAWLRICQNANENAAISQPFDPERIPQLITELKALMLSYTPSTLEQSLQELLANYGIAFSLVHHFKGAPVHGYVTKHSDGSFRMAVTIRDSWEDIFWFSLFHEIGHINNCDISTQKREFLDIGNNDDQEQLADNFARDALIDPAAYSTFIELGSFSYKEIEHFANKQGVKPSIVIGRLQKEGVIPWSRFAKRKPRLKWCNAN